MDEVTVYQAHYDSRDEVEDHLWTILRDVWQLVEPRTFFILHYLFINLLHTFTWFCPFQGIGIYLVHLYIIRLSHLDVCFILLVDLLLNRKIVCFIFILSDTCECCVPVRYLLRIIFISDVLLLIIVSPSGFMCKVKGCADWGMYTQPLKIKLYRQHADFFVTSNYIPRQLNAADHIDFRR